MSIKNITCTFELISPCVHCILYNYGGILHIVYEKLFFIVIINKYLSGLKFYNKYIFYPNDRTFIKSQQDL